ncbi:MAG: hypothetical protein JNL23_03790 [Chitinophagaceae bacterium]|nr:hypothetical protein [Chitinophagaceae bacterium]
MTVRLLLLLVLINSFGYAKGQQKTVTLKGAKQTPQKRPSNEPPPPPGPKIVTPVKDLGYLIPPLHFTPDTISYTPSSFYFHSVIDSTGADSVGFGILPKDYKKKTITTAGKKDVLILKYLRSITKTDTSLIPIVVVLKTLQISEKQLNKADLNAKIELYINVYALVNNELIFLDDAGGVMENQIYVGFKRQYDMIICFSLKRITSQLENRIQNAKPYLESLEKGVFVIAKIKSFEESNTDTIYISNNYTLAWSDYHGKPINDKGISPSLRVELSINDMIVDKKLTISVVIEPVFVRSRSWAGKLVQSDQLLKHEYYKTQLMYLYALKLKKQISESHFPLKELKDNILALYSKSNNFMEDELQKYVYDTESGSNKAKQDEWEKSITLQIEELKDYNSFFTR